MRHAQFYALSRVGTPRISFKIFRSRRAGQTARDRPALARRGGALFQLANEFGVRHQNANQRTDYDEQLYLEWIFYWYLATINLTDRIISGQADMPQPAGGPLAQRQEQI